MSSLLVVDAGWATTIQDRGRPGHAHLGVPPSGAVDLPAATLVNRLVGNDDGAAVLETAGGLRLRVHGAAVVAVSSEAAVRTLAAGEELIVPVPEDRMWTYVAVRGGVAVAPVLGSRSQDSRSGLGPPAVGNGEALPVGADPGTPIVVDQAPSSPAEGPVPVWPGPRLDRFAAGALETLAAVTWTVSPDVSRVGVRLRGAQLLRREDSELPSEGLVTGAATTPSSRAKGS